MKKLWVLALAAGLAGLWGGASRNVAQAQAPDGYTYAPNGYTYTYDPLGASREQLAAAAHSMSDEAEHIAHFLRATAGLSHLTDDAIALSRSSELFHRMVESGASLPQLQADFRGMSREFAMLARNVEGVHDIHHGAHFQQDWAQLRQAYMTTAQILQQASAARPPHRIYPGHRYYTYYRPMPRPVPPRRGWQFRIGRF